MKIESAMWIITILSIIGVILNIRKNRLCFRIWLITNACWMAFGRITFIWTVDEFYSIREKLSGIGFEMCEIERIIYNKPETIL